MSTFLITDPAVRDQLTELLTPHQITADPMRAPMPVNDALERIHHLEAEAQETQGLLARAVADLAITRTARSTAEQEAENLKARIVELETELGTAGRDLELAEGEVRKLQADIADLVAERKAKNKATPPALRATGSRAVDRQAWEALADRMNRQAAPLEKQLGDILRIASRAVRDEAEKLYGGTGKKAS